MNNTPPEDDEIGYGKPPKKNQFKKGISGNPRGRPRKARSDDLSAIAILAATRRVIDRKIDIFENGKKKQISLLEALISQAVQAALKAKDAKAIIQLLAYLEKMSRSATEGQGSEPIRLIIQGGLPDIEDYERWLRETGQEHPLTGSSDASPKWDEDPDEPVCC